MLPVDYADDFTVRVGGPGHHDVSRLEVWMADAETTETGALRDE